MKLNKGIVKRGIKYEVYINHCAYHLTSKRAALDFLRGADNYLTDQYELLNVNLVGVYSTYRSMSAYLEHYDLKAIRLQINEVEQAIELTATRCGWENYTSFSFDKLGVSIDNLIGVLKRMEEISKRKKYTVIRADIRAKICTCELQIRAAQEFNFSNRKYKANSGQIIEINKKQINFKS